MEYKLEITKRLEELAATGDLDEGIAILNMPTANYCEKRAERVEVDGKLEQSCLGCITQQIKGSNRLTASEIEGTIDHFAQQHGTKFITINGRGDPFHPSLKEETLRKIAYAADRGIKSYVFTAGDNLDAETCDALAEYGANVMISLYGNKFIDADFFAGKEYARAEWPLQDQAKIAGNLRNLTEAYKRAESKPEDGTTRIGMNYVVSENDLADNGAKVKALKAAANNARVFFICNTPFGKNPDDSVQQSLEQLARECSDFHLRHTTAVNDRCQMGAGSSATVDYDGTLLRCPYMDNKQGDGNIRTLSLDEREAILASYKQDRSYPCVMRKHQK